METDNRKTTTYLNTAGCGIIPDTVLAAGAHLYQQFAVNSSGASERWRVEEGVTIRKNLAAFIGATSQDTALIPNFSYAFNAVVHSLTGKEKVLLYKKDFPSVFIPFLLNNFNVVWIDDTDGFFIDLNKIETLIKKEHIDIVAISHVQWMSGFKLDLKALCTFCRANKVKTLIDATQSMGAVAIDVNDMQPDVLIGSSYKWMNAGFGTGLLYMHPSFAEQYPSKISGAHSAAYNFAEQRYTPDHAISNYEPGSPDMFGFTLLSKAVDEKNVLGISSIEAANRLLTETLLQGLAGLPVELIGPGTTAHRHSIVVLKENGDLHRTLAAHNIITTGRNGLVRISIHYHNTAADIDAVISCIADWSRKRL